jgi:hypothetical protein
MGRAAEREEAAEVAKHQQGRLSPMPPPATAPPRPKTNFGVLGILALVLVVATVALLLVLPVIVLVVPLTDTDSDTNVSPTVRQWIAASMAGLLLLAFIPTRRRWLLERTPTIPVGAAVAGTCEVAGTVEAIEASTSWFTGQPCVWWEAHLMRGYGKNQRTVWTAEGGTDRCYLVGDDGGRIGVVLHGPRRWRRPIVRITGTSPYGGENGLVVGDRLLVLGDVSIVNGQRVITAKRATQHTEASERSLLRWGARVAVLLAAAGAGYLAAVTPDFDDLELRAGPGWWAAAGAAAVLVPALVFGWIGNRRANPEFVVGSAFS